MDFQRKKQEPNLQWKSEETIKLIRAMKNHQLLWIQHIFLKLEYRTAVKTAQRRLATLIKRPWIDIPPQLTRLRFEFKARKMTYYREIKRSLTMDNGEVRKPTKIFDYELVFILFCLFPLFR